MTYNPFLYDRHLEQERFEISPLVNPDVRTYLMDYVFFAIVLIGWMAAAFTKNWYFIYLIIIFFNQGVGAAQMFLRKLLGTYQSFGSAQSLIGFIVATGVGVGAGLFFVFLEAHFFFSVGLVNFPAPPASVGIDQTLSEIITAFVLIWVAPELEEPFREFFVELFKRITRVVKLGPPLTMVGVTLFALLFNSAAYIGIIVIFIGAMVTAYEYKRQNSPVYHEKLYFIIISAAVALVSAGIIFGALHAFAYLGSSNFEISIYAAMYFGIGMGLINYFTMSKYASKPGHSTYNTFAYAAGGGSLALGFTFMLTYILYNFGVARPHANKRR